MHEKVSYLLMEVKDYIKSNLHLPLSIAALCRKFNTNKTSLQERFRDYHGTTVHACLLQARMEKARLLLIESDFSVKQIAIQCGYRKIHSFNKAFRIKYLLSPGRYRKQALSVESHTKAVESHLV